MGGINCIDYSTLTVSNTALVVATACSPTMPERAKGAEMTVETDAIRFRIDGDAPTSTEGTLLNIGDILNYDSWTTPRANWRSVLNAIQVIRVTTDAKLKIHWYD